MGGDEREAAEYAPEENPDYEAFVLVRAFLDELPAHGDAIAGYSRNGLRHALTEPMLRALVAGYEKLRTERSAVLARGAELEAENARMREELEALERKQFAEALNTGPGVWCWNRRPDYQLACGRFTGHEGDHVRGERRWANIDAAAPQQPVRDTADGGVEHG